MISITGKYLFDPESLTNKHQNQQEWKTTAFINFDKSELHLYYSWFIKKRFNLELNKPIRDTHISFISDKLTKDQYEKYLIIKEKYNNIDIIIEYNQELIRTNGNHWWIKIESKELDNVRNIIGLDKIYFPYHITLGYVSDKNIQHSEYIHRQILKYNL